MSILQKDRHFANSPISARQEKKTFHHIREKFAREFGIEASDHANPKIIKMNQGLTGNTGITNLIPHLTPIGIVFVIRWPEPDYFKMLVCILLLCFQNVVVSKSRHQILFYPTGKEKSTKKILFF